MRIKLFRQKIYLKIGAISRSDMDQHRRRLRGAWELESPLGNATEGLSPFP